jgi:hypothetical protein
MTATIFLGGRGWVLEDNGIVFKGKEVSPSLVTTLLIGGGVGKPKVGKTSKLLGLNHFTISRETRVSKLSPSK